ncbi:MAG: alpha/beta hydrolase family esterase [Pararhodobacter sp.]
MNDEFAEAMRRSMDLTRAGNPAEATRVIQEALQGRGGTSPAPLTLDGPVQKPARKPTRGTVEDAEVLSSTPPRRPLGDVIAALRKRPQGFGMPGPVTPSVPDIPGTTFERRTYSGPQGARDYRLFLPSTHAEGVKGLIVMLHGCTQSPEDFAAGTAMNAQAEQHGFAIIWPEQTRTHNPSLCWNWFRAGDQGRAGEPAILQAIAASVAAEFHAPHVFVAGLSAGGAMAAILGQSYPETFAAVGVHSGLAPGAAQDVVSAFGAMQGNAVAGTALKVPAIVFHGTSDNTVAPGNAARVTGPLRAAETRKGQSTGRRFTVTEGQNAAGHPVESWSIDGAGHAWAGGSASGSYTDPAGPDASREMMRFFRQRMV